jgi:hypothetical protein
MLIRIPPPGGFSLELIGNISVLSCTMLKPKKLTFTGLLRFYQKSLEGVIYSLEEIIT